MDFNETWHNIHHVSGNCRKCFHGQRSKVKDIARPNRLFRLKDHHQLTAVRPLTPILWRDISLFRGAISIKLTIDIHHVVGTVEKVFSVTICDINL